MKELKEIYRVAMEDNRIDPSLYARYRVKQGLRNENGTGVKVGLTKICDVVGYQMIHGHKHDIDGQLIYRGYSVSDLVARQPEDTICGYEETAFLLIFGRLPSAQEREIFRTGLHEQINTDFINAEYETSNLLNALQIEILKLYGNDPDPDFDSLEERMSKGISILGSIPLFVFSNYHHHCFAKYPLPDKGLAENILALARRSTRYTMQEARVMDTLLMLHADHGGGNNSTFANVVITSTGTDIYSCISAAIGSLKGPRHGGAAEKMSGQCEMILEQCRNGWDDEKLECIAYKLLAKEAYDRSGLIYGIGHAIYTKSDPRAVLIKAECRKLAAEQGKMDEFILFDHFEQAAKKAMKRAKGIDCCANVDFYSGFAYRMLSIEPCLYTALFAISRTAGWIAHHLENRQSNRKLIRPANIYVGERKEINESDNHSI